MAPSVVDRVRPAQRVGSWVKFSRYDGITTQSGTITHAIARHSLTHKPAYMVDGYYYTGIVHADEVLEYGPVRT